MRGFEKIPSGKEQTSRIICVGNRYFAGDDLGAKVYDRLRQRPLPAGVEVIDGGLMGLNLLKYAEGVKRLVFVDTVSGFGNENEIVVLDRETVCAKTEAGYGHSGGLAYLFQVFPLVFENELPEILLVGAPGASDERTVNALADACLQVVGVNQRMKAEG